VALAQTASLEEAARLLWGCGGHDPFTESAARESPPALGTEGTAIDRALRHLAAAGLSQGATWQRRPEALWGAAARLLRGCAAAAAAAELRPDRRVDEMLAEAWGVVGNDAAALRRALVLCADHELNASTFAVRIVASTGASLAACLTAGLAALSGPLHGGATERVEALVDEVEWAGDAWRVVEERLRRGDPLPGFGHPLYPAGDPRCAALLAAAALDGRVAALAVAGERIGGRPPNLDFGLVALRRSLGLPRGAALALFAIGRLAGWIAHALEQQATGKLLRPRARYVGPAPESVRDSSPLAGEEGAHGKAMGR
jgi:citrate synthase